MKTTNKYTVIDTHIVGAEKYEIREYANANAIRIFRINADNTATPIKREEYFSLCEKQAEEQLNVAKIRRELNNGSSERTNKFDWDSASNVERHEYRLENSSAVEIASKVLANLEHIEVLPYVDFDNDVVNPGGWLFNRPDGVLGFIEQYTRGSKKNLYTVINEEGLMGGEGTEFTKEQFISSKVRQLGDKFLFNRIEASGKIISSYMIDKDRTPEDETEIILGTKSIEDFQSLVVCYEIYVFDTSFLVHCIMKDSSNEERDKVYFIEQTVRLNGDDVNASSDDTTVEAL